jgi:xanthine dehydrogenase accessory factor
MRVWSRLLDFLDRDGRAVLVTVREARGSTPREAGARMLVRADGSFSGTIGGGTLEWIALGEARALMGAREVSRALDKALGPDLGQCCGGFARLSLERFEACDRAWIAPLARREGLGGAFETAARADGRGVLVRALIPARDTALPSPLRGGAGGGGVLTEDAGEATFAPARSSEAISPHPRPLPTRGRGGSPSPDGSALLETFGTDATPILLFGAGHVGRALVLALAPLPVAVTWVDSRADAFPTHVPGNVVCLAPADPVAALGTATPGTLVLVMTHAHDLDLALVAAALPDPRFPFVGLIGSATKRARFSRRMRDGGLSAETVGRLVCPIGLPGIVGKEPAVIAAGVAAQVLLERGRLSAAATPGLAQFRSRP